MAGYWGTENQWLGKHYKKTCTRAVKLTPDRARPFSSILHFNDLICVITYLRGNWIQLTDFTEKNTWPHRMWISGLILKNARFHLSIKSNNSLFHFPSNEHFHNFMPFSFIIFWKWYLSLSTTKQLWTSYFTISSSSFCFAAEIHYGTFSKTILWRAWNISCRNNWFLYISVCCICLSVPVE